MLVMAHSHSHPTSLPTRLNVDTAWATYQALVLAANDDPSLRASLEHSIQTARAWKRWSELFLAMDVAA